MVQPITGFMFKATNKGLENSYGKMGRTMKATGLRTKWKVLADISGEKIIHAIRAIL